MFGCGVTVLQNMVSSSDIFAVLHHLIPGNTLGSAIQLQWQKRQIVPTIDVFNDYDNNGSEP